MHTKVPLIVGAQKLYLSLEDSLAFAEALRKALRKKYSFDIAVCPSFINLAHVAGLLRGSQVGIGAQNVHQEDTGAFTGQVSIQELLRIGVTYVIVGHSELRREGETNGLVRRKAQICLKRGAVPIVCIGEDREDREAGRSQEVIRQDIKTIFEGINPDIGDLQNIVVAYEPIWAIKMGRDDKRTKAARASEVNEMHLLIRKTLSSIYGTAIGQNIRVIYGGSVTSQNTQELLKEPYVDGLLIGTASIKVKSFLAILDAADELMTEKVLLQAV